MNIYSLALQIYEYIFNNYSHQAKIICKKYMDREDCSPNIHKYPINIELYSVLMIFAPIAFNLSSILEYPLSICSI